MAVLCPCPDRSVLESLLQQGGAVDDVERLEHHLSTCVYCGEIVDGVLSADPLAREVRGTVFTPDDTAVRLLQSRLARLLPSASRRAAPDDTLAADETDLAATAAATSEFPFLAAAQQADEIGRLAHYRILKKIGAGGMGVVFLAEDTLLGRKVALKTMLPAVAVRPDARERFFREAKAAAAIEHPHIVPILHVGEDGGVPFLAMPFLQGESLESRLERDSCLPPVEAARLAIDMADGLAAAHAHGLIHRDIKPGNCWLEGGPARVRLLDFGLARSEDDATRLTQLGAIVGTPGFMPPEQAQGQCADARADLFSLGCVLYVMTTGQRPFRGDSLFALLTSLSKDTPLAPHVLRADVPRALSDLILRLLAKDRDQRPASAHEVADQLRRIVQVESAARRQRPRRRFTVGLGLLLGAAVVVVGIILIVRDKDGKKIAEVNVPDGGKVEAIDPKSGQATPLPIPPLRPPDKPAERPITVGARVTITAYTAGYADEANTTLDRFITKGSKGTIVKLLEEQNCCLIRLDGPGKIEVWVSLRLVEPQ
jgi:serine/threonine protein kinase